MKIFKYKTNLIYLYSGVSTYKFVVPDFVEIRELNNKNISKDKFLLSRRRDLSGLLKQGHQGFGLYDKNNNKFFAYAWIASQRDSTPPAHIKKMPEDSFWDHFTRVSEGYQGHGYQRLLIQERRIYLEKKYGGNIKLFSDTSIDNTPSRKNLLKMGFKEYGVYTSLFVRIAFKSVFLYTNWNKNKKHPTIKRI